MKTYFIIAELLCAMLLVLKLFNVIDISYWVVFAPIWSIVPIIFASVIIYVILSLLFKQETNDK